MEKFLNVLLEILCTGLQSQSTSYKPNYDEIARLEIVTGIVPSPFPKPPLMLMSGNPDDIPYEKRLYAVAKPQSTALADAILKDIYTQGKHGNVNHN